MNLGRRVLFVHYCIGDRCEHARDLGPVVAHLACPHPTTWRLEVLSRVYVRVAKITSRQSFITDLLDEGVADFLSVNPRPVTALCGLNWYRQQLY
jgi:hypothetical protein